MLLRMHRRKPNFNPLKKSTPSRIANKKLLPEEELKEYFLTHSLKECAQKYNCAAVTIKRILRKMGVDTSIHNHSELAKHRYNDSSLINKPTNEQLRILYIDQNLDSKTIAEMYKLHYQTIRRMIQTCGYRKSRESIAASMSNRHYLKYGTKHPAQRNDVRKKTSMCYHKAFYKETYFKSITELGYALYLDQQNIKWHYEEMLIPYIDMITGQRRIYAVDFTIELNDQIHWVEVRPNNEMIPDDKRIYASRRAEEADVIFRGLTEIEREGLWSCINNGYHFEQVEFMYRAPRPSSKKITYYFKSKSDVDAFNMDGWRELDKPSNMGALWKKILVREK